MAREITPERDREIAADAARSLYRYCQSLVEDAKIGKPPTSATLASLTLAAVTLQSYFFTPEEREEHRRQREEQEARRIR